MDSSIPPNKNYFKTRWQRFRKHRKPNKKQKATTKRNHQEKPPRASITSY